MKNKKRTRGFTLIEVLIVIGIISILAAVVLIAINPGRQFAQARNTQRSSNVAALINAIGHNIADNRGTFTCGGVTLPATSTPIKSGAGGISIRDCIVPAYISEIPFDPSTGHVVDSTDYDTGYTISEDSMTKRITITAPGAELETTISLTR